MNEGKFKFLDQHRECLFTPRLRLRFSDMFSLTPFACKGRAAWHDNGAKVTGRLPIASTLFFLLWLVIFAIDYFRTGDLLYLGGWLFVVIYMIIFIPLESRRMKIMIEELKEILSY
jgi:hypothetical protein